MRNILNCKIKIWRLLKFLKYVKIKTMDNKQKILIIDDDKLLLDMYAIKFREEMFDVDIAVGSREALDKIKNGAEPDVILLDIVMPGMDGFELMETIKKEKLAQNSKIIFLTNLGQKEDINRGMSLGASDYIIKAYFTPSEVVARVKEILKK